MTEKRYKAIPETVEYKDTVTGEFLSPKFEEGFYKVLDLLNENEELKQELDELKEENGDLNEEVMEHDSFALLYKEQRDELKEENEQLQQRNKRQYNQLTELWEIIEEENWEKLIAMKKQLHEDEERLQQEWKCYE